MAENQFNEPPPDGFRFVGIPVKLDYSGDGSASVLTVTANAVGDSNVAYGKLCGVIPGETRFTDVFAGGAARRTDLSSFRAWNSTLTVYAGALLEDAVFFATQ